MPSPRAIAAVATLALTLGACGSDDGGGGSSAGSESAGDFAAAVDDVCREHATAVNEVAEQYGIPTGFADAAAYEIGRADAAAAQADAAAALDAGADGAGLVAALQEYADNYADIAKAASGTDEEAYDAAIERGQQLANDQLDAAEALGLEACARKLPPEQEAAVRELTERLLTGSDPERSCADEMTDNFRRVSAGRGARCIEQLTALAEDGATVEYLFTTGVEGVVASANVDLATSAMTEPKYVIYDLLWDEAAMSWKVDSAFDTGQEAPAAEDPNAEGSA